MDTKQADAQYITHTYQRFPVEFVSGHGAYLQDAQGKEYLDFGCGIGVTGLGHANRLWTQAVCEQAGRLAHTSNLFYTRPCAQLAQTLCERSGMKKAFFSNSGAEANECAVKTARKYSSDRYGAGRSTIVTLVNSFHGRTMATLSATGQECFHRHFAPFLDGFVSVPANDTDALVSALDGTVCAVMFEPVQGEGGVMPLDREYLQALAWLCAERDILTIADEVQTGNGRTGTLYACEQFGIVPDLMTTAKGLGNGLPIGATLFGEKTADTMDAGTHGSTFGGNPVACAGALAVLRQIDEPLLRKVRENGEKLAARLSRMRGVESVSGLGLMIGIACKGDAKTIANRCLDKGLVVLTAKTKVRLLPPLNLTDEELERGIQILEEVFDETFA